MQNIFNYIDNLILIAVIILAIYLLNSIFRTRVVKNFIENLEGFGDFTFTVISMNSIRLLDWSFRYIHVIFHNKKISDINWHACRMGL